MLISSANIKVAGQDTTTYRHSSFSDSSENRFICCGGGHCKKNNRPERFTMGVRDGDVICEGVLEKKTDRRFSFGPAWKRKYCLLNSEALHIYGSKTKTANPSRIIPLCHMKDVKRLIEDSENQIFYFDVTTEQGENLTFRCRHDQGWAAQIQIQIIFYKVRNYSKTRHFLILFIAFSIHLWFSLIVLSWVQISRWLRKKFKGN